MTEKLMKVWAVTKGPIDIEKEDFEEYPHELPDDGSRFMVDCKVEINGKLFDREFWFKAEDMAYDFKHTIDASMEAVEVEFDF